MRMRWLLLLAAAVVTSAALVDATVSSARSMPSPTTTVYAWIGLKNSDDVGTRFDLRAEVSDGSSDGYGTLPNFSGGSSGFNNAHLATIPVVGYSGGSGPQPLTLTIWVRVACQSGHSSGTARLWWNDSQANSRVVDSGFGTAYLSGPSALSPIQPSGPKMTKDVYVKKNGCPGDGGTWQTLGTWTADRQPQTISFSTTAPSVFLNEFDSYTPAATATSGLPVSISLDAGSSACFLSGGVVYPESFGFGTCVIDANQAGNALWLPAPQVQQSFGVDISLCGPGTCVECTVTDPTPGSPACSTSFVDLFAGRARGGM